MEQNHQHDEEEQPDVEILDMFNYRQLQRSEQPKPSLSLYIQDIVQKGPSRTTPDWKNGAQFFDRKNRDALLSSCETTWVARFWRCCSQGQVSGQKEISEIACNGQQKISALGKIEPRCGVTATLRLDGRNEFVFTSRFVRVIRDSKKTVETSLPQPTCHALKTSERPQTNGPVVVGIHLRALLTKKKLQAWECVQSSISTQAAGEPKKRNHSVTVTNTLDTTQEEEITSLKFKAKKDLLHVVSAIPMKFSSQQTE